MVAHALSPNMGGPCEFKANTEFYLELLSGTLTRKKVLQRGVPLFTAPPKLNGFLFYIRYFEESPGIQKKLISFPHLPEHWQSEMLSCLFSHLKRKLVRNYLSSHKSSAVFTVTFCGKTGCNWSGPSVSIECVTCR